MTTTPEARDPTANDRCASDGPKSAADTDANVEALERRLASVEAELDAVRGLLDGVDAVDEAIERRASIALAKVESLERQLAPEADGLFRERLPERSGRQRQGGRGEQAQPTETEGQDRRTGTDRQDRRTETEGYDRRTQGGGSDDAPGVYSADRSTTGYRIETDDAGSHESSQSDGEGGSLATRLRDAFQ